MDAERGGRTLHILAFAITVTAVAIAMTLVLRRSVESEASAPAVTVTAFAAAEAAPSATRGPRRDPRVPLYLVSTPSEKRTMERALVAMGYIELNGGTFAGSWVVMVMEAGMTLEMVEHMNLARISSGELPYRVVDARQ